MEFPAYYWVDVLTCSLIALAAACRAGVYGMHFTGAVSLGALAGLASPVLRDILLSFGSVAALHDGFYAGAAVAGAMLGKALSGVSAPGIFRWSEAASLGLATAMGASRAAVLGFTPVGCILLGLSAGLLGPLVRDVCLGDTPRAFEAEFYVTACAMGAMCVLAVDHVGLPSIIQVAAGAWVVMVLRMYGHHRERGRGQNS